MCAAARAHGARRRRVEQSRRIDAASIEVAAQRGAAVDVTRASRCWYALAGSAVARAGVAASAVTALTCIAPAISRASELSATPVRVAVAAAPLTEVRRALPLSVAFEVHFGVFDAQILPAQRTRRVERAGSVAIALSRAHAARRWIVLAESSSELSDGDIPAHAVFAPSFQRVRARDAVADANRIAADTVHTVPGITGIARPISRTFTGARRARLELATAERRHFFRAVIAARAQARVAVAYAVAMRAVTHVPFETSRAWVPGLPKRALPGIVRVIAALALAALALLTAHAVHASA